MATDSLRVGQRALNLRVVECPREFEETLGFLRREIRETLGLPFVALFEPDRGRVIHCLAAPDTDRLRSGRLTVAADARDRSDRVALLVGDVLSVEAGEFTITLLGEHRDVASRNARPAHPAVVLLDMSLVEVSRGEERGGGLSEVGECHGFADTSPLRSLVECLRYHPIGDRLGRGDLAPQRCLGVVAVGVCIEPAVDVRHCWDEQDGSTTLLPVDGDLETVSVVLDVAHGERFELTAPEAGIELEGDHRRIPRVVTPVSHRDNVLLPAEHLAGIGRRVVVARCAGRHPLDRFGWVFAVGDALCEDAERRPVVPVGLLVIVGAIDPADDRLCGGAALEGRRENSAVEFLGHDRDVPEELLVSVIAVGLGEEIEAVAKLQQELAIGVGDLVAPLDALFEALDSVPRCRCHGESLSGDGHKNVALNLGLVAPPWLESLGSEPLREVFGGIGISETSDKSNLRFEALTDEPHVAIASGNRGVPA